MTFFQVGGQKLDIFVLKFVAIFNSNRKKFEMKR